MTTIEDEPRAPAPQPLTQIHPSISLSFVDAVWEGVVLNNTDPDPRYFRTTDADWFEKLVNYMAGVANN
jgi:hypothetical protein